MGQLLISNYLKQLDPIKNVIDLFARVTIVSVETERITQAMKEEAR